MLNVYGVTFFCGGIVASSSTVETFSRVVIRVVCPRGVATLASLAFKGRQLFLHMRTSYHVGIDVGS